MELVTNEQKEKIQLSYKDLNNNAFVTSLRGLVNHKWDSMQTAYKFTRVMDAVDSYSKQAHDTWLKIMDTQVEWELDENGKKTKPKDEAKFKEVEEEFLKMSFDLGKWTKFNVNELIGYKFSAVELNAIQPLLTGLEQLEGE